MLICTLCARTVKSILYGLLWAYRWGKYTILKIIFIQTLSPSLCHFVFTCSFFGCFLSKWEETDLFIRAFVWISSDFYRKPENSKETEEYGLTMFKRNRLKVYHCFKTFIISKIFVVLFSKYRSRSYVFGWLLLWFIIINCSLRHTIHTYVPFHYKVHETAPDNELSWIPSHPFRSFLFCVLSIQPFTRIFHWMKEKHTL